MIPTLRLFVIISLLILTAGCNQSGMNLGSGDSGAGVSSFSASSSPVGGADGLDSGSGEQVALVHQPEPTSMLLWGVGLAGAALARRRKKIRI